MNNDPLAAWRHEHDFHTDKGQAERNTRLVLWITAAAMVVEIAAGWWFNSMALLADGWHMSSHALAIGQREDLCTIFLALSVNRSVQLATCCLT